jgi:hypothetical protein
MSGRRNFIERKKTTLNPPDCYSIYHIQQGKDIKYSLGELKTLGEDLPRTCKITLLKIDADPTYNMTLEESANMITLLSLSMSTVWGGSPRGRLPEITMQDYRNEFYIRMMHHLRRFDRSKGCWVYQCKFMAHETIATYVNTWKKQRRMEKRLEDAYYQLQDEYPEFWEITAPS